MAVLRDRSLVRKWPVAAVRCWLVLTPMLTLLITIGVVGVSAVSRASDPMHQQVASETNTESGVVPDGAGHLKQGRHQDSRYLQHNLNGSFLALGGVMLFFEGLTAESRQQILNQVLWGGAVPGLLLGSRPLVRELLTRANTAAPLLSLPPPGLVHLLQSAAGYSLALLGRLANIGNIINAGWGYTTISAMFALLDYKSVLYNLGLQWQSLQNLQQAIACVPGAAGRGVFLWDFFVIDFILRKILQTATGQQIHLQDHFGRYFFVYVDAPRSLPGGTTIEIYRTGHSAPVPNPHGARHHLLTRLAQAMDRVGASKLSLLVQTTANGNTLSLALERKTGLPVNTAAIALDYGPLAYTPWLEAQLLTVQGLEPGSYLSVFQESILCHIVDAISYIGNDRLVFPEGGVAETGSNAGLPPVYRPPYTDLQVVTVTDGDGATNKIELGDPLDPLYIRASRTEIELSSSPEFPLQNLQIWIPAWLTSFLTAEVSAAVRDRVMDLVQNSLYRAAQRLNLEAHPPAGRARETATTVNGDGVHENRTRFPGESSTQTIQITGLLFSGGITWGSTPSAEPQLWAESDYGVLSDAQIRKSPRDKLQRFQSGRPHPDNGRAGGIVHGHALTPYAVGIVDDMERITQGSAACVICFEEASQAQPLYRCPHQCAAGKAHLGCLDQYAFNRFNDFTRWEEITSTGTGTLRHPPTTATPCPVCRQPMTTAVRWLSSY